jgi:Fungal specific transcription factor domain
MHVVVALGSLHEVYQETKPGLPESTELTNKREFAIEQSNKAMSLLRSHISTGASHSGEIVLIACLLFICLETFQGNHKSALTHLDSGLKVLQSWLRDEEPNFCKEMTVTRPSRTFVESSLIPIFARLDIQASTHIVSRPLHCDLVLKSLDVSDAPEIPESFSTVYEASDSLLGLVYYMFHLQQVAHGYYDPAREGSPYKCPEGLVMMFLTAREQNREQLDVWLEKLNTLLKTSASSMSMRELRASILLKVHYLFVAIMLGASGANDETKFDNFTAEFGQMLKLAESLLGPSTPLERSGQKPSYVFDTNIIPPLYMGATRCRDPQLRRKALNLLWSLKSREGIWDSNVAAAIGKWVMEKEEEGLGNIYGPQSVPIEKRITLFGKGTMCGERMVLVKYRQGPAVPGNVDTEEEYLTWSNENGLQQGLRE